MNAPAAELRQAAASMREQHGPEHVRHLFWHNLADLLDITAALVEANAGRYGGVQGSIAVYLVAQSYLDALNMSPISFGFRPAEPHVITDGKMVSWGPVLDPPWGSDHR